MPPWSLTFLMASSPASTMRAAKPSIGPVKSREEAELDVLGHGGRCEQQRRRGREAERVC